MRGYTIQHTYGVMQAGGNAGGDLDHLGQPVKDGAFYVVQIASEGRYQIEERIIDGPWWDGEQAEERAQMFWLDEYSDEA